MASSYESTHEFKGASFTLVDFTGATFRDCDLTGVRIVDSVLMNIDVAGDAGPVLVNDVDVTAFVEAELDRRHPERVRLRAMTTADDYRAMWGTLEDLWAETVERAAWSCPRSALTAGTRSAT